MDQEFSVMSYSPFTHVEYSFSVLVALDMLVLLDIFITSFFDLNSHSGSNTLSNSTSSAF